MMADIPHRKSVPGCQIQTSYSPHSRTRTTSSSVFPVIQYPERAQYQHNAQYAHMPGHAYTTSPAAPSQKTFSSQNSVAGQSPITYRQYSADLQRSTSSRSGGSPTGYVALMRKQKATVWCDRSQHEDPRLLAQQKAARIRANLEVIGGKTQGRLSTSGSGNAGTKGGVTAKIRHHGKANLKGYSPGDLVVGGGVPMRLSASEVEREDTDDDAASGHGSHNQRSGSGRSSLGSGRRGLTYRQSGTSSTGRWSSGNTTPGEMTDLREAGETPVPAAHSNAKDYFSTDGTRDGTQSAGSGSSGERADDLGELGSEKATRLASNSLMKSTLSREKSTKNPDELRRRGSVDERDMTLSTGRLYIANPDEDSD